MKGTQARSWMAAGSRGSVGSRRLLFGWAEIEAYVEVDRKTLRLWKEKWGFPATKILGGVVVAHKDAVIEWWFRLARLERKLKAAGRKRSAVVKGPAWSEQEVEAAVQEEFGGEADLPESPGEVASEP